MGLRHVQLGNLVCGGKSDLWRQTFCRGRNCLAGGFVNLPRVSAQSAAAYQQVEDEQCVCTVAERAARGQAE